MTTARLDQRITSYLSAFSQLQRALEQPRDEFMRDSIIQRFEFTHELAWKMLKLRLEAEGIFVNTPRETLQAALQAGFIVDGNGWSDLQRMRNLTSHTYDETLASTVCDFIGGPGQALFAALASLAAQWRQQ